MIKLVFFDTKDHKNLYAILDYNNSIFSYDKLNYCEFTDYLNNTDKISNTNLILIHKGELERGTSNEDYISACKKALDTQKPFIIFSGGGAPPNPLNMANIRTYDLYILEQDFKEYTIKKDLKILFPHTCNETQHEYWLAHNIGRKDNKLIITDLIAREIGAEYAPRALNKLKEYFQLIWPSAFPLLTEKLLNPKYLNFIKDNIASIEQYEALSRVDESWVSEDSAFYNLLSFIEEDNETITRYLLQYDLQDIIWWETSGKTLNNIDEELFKIHNIITVLLEKVVKTKTISADEIINFKTNINNWSNKVHKLLEDKKKIATFLTNRN